MSTFTLGDDGTLDTVIVCDQCGEKFRFNYSNDDPDNIDMTDEESYDAFVEQCLEDAADVHNCDTPLEPDDEDITTADHQHFFYLGRQIVACGPDGDDWRSAVTAWCDANNYYPNIWFISDHGNAHLLSVTDDRRNPNDQHRTL